MSPRISSSAAAAGALGLLALLAFLDFLTPQNVIVPIAYGFPVGLCAWVPRRRFLWSLTLLAIALNFARMLLGPPPSPEAAQWAALVNRALAAIVTLAAAALVHLRAGEHRWIEGERADFQRRNVEFESANRELERSEQEISRQNEELQSQTEELQSQTEELERQSEELRVTNEELAHWEKMLEQLLELSRSLTGDLDRNQTLTRICESLGQLMEGTTVAILERQGDELVEQCHYGFGPDGPLSRTIPFTSSFAALVMTAGHTGYLEDLRLRPDLCVLGPRDGEPFRAVLSSPFRVRGACVGVIEAYARVPRAWSEAQIALIESLAAQTAISLQTSELMDELRKERQLFETVFRTVPLGLAVALDPEQRHVRLNPAGAALLNLPVNENIAPATPAGLKLSKALQGAGPGLPDPLTRALRGVEVIGEELQLVLPVGRTLHLLVGAAPFHDARGRIAGAVQAFADISTQTAQRRELERRRREAEEASLHKTRFLAAVSHDIRTPANAIGLMAELIRRYASHGELSRQIPELAERLQANIRSMMDLVGDLLDIARFDSGKIEMVESEFTLDQLIAEECRHLAPLAQEKGLELRFDPLGHPIWVRTDRVKLARVLGNLIGNAIKFTPSGEVRLGAVVTPAPDPRILIRVADSGIGIPADQLERVFDEFAQLRNPERAEGKGSGLGLSICRRLVEAMGGSITVESKVGRGSVFTVALPSSSLVLRIDAVAPVPPPDGPRTAQDPGSRRLRGLRVLLVEDHQVTREGTRQLLEGEGAIIREAPDGRTALDLLRKERFDVLLLDLMLPDLDGREVLRAVQAHRPEGLRSVLVLTGDLTQERLDEVRQLGPDGLISKPIAVANLLAALEALIRPE